MISDAERSLALVSAVLLLIVGCSKRTPDRSVVSQGAVHENSEEPIAWPARNRLVLLVRDEWRSGPDAVQLGCQLTGVYAVDSLGRRVPIRAGADICYPGIHATDVDISPDGRWLVWSDSVRIYQAELPAGKAQAMAFHGLRFAGFPSYSVDGRWLGFLGARTSRDYTSEQHGVYVCSRDGSACRMVLALKGTGLTSAPSWSRTSDEWAVSTFPHDSAPYVAAGKITIANASGAWRTIGSGYGPSWSPDGKWIAYLSLGQRTESDGSRTAVASIRLVRPDGGGDRMLYQSSDAGRFGAFRDKSASGIPAGRLVWAGDGRTIAFSRIFDGRWTAWAIDLDGSNLRELSSQRPPQ